MSGAAAAPAGSDAARSMVRALPHFASLSDEQADRLLAGAVCVRVAAGEAVLRPGPLPDAVRFLVKGRWTMRRHVRGLDAAVVWTDDRPGNWHGESGLVDAIAPAEVVADAPCEVLVVPRPLLDALLSECPPLAHAMLRGLRGGCELLWRAVEEATPAHMGNGAKRRG